MWGLLEEWRFWVLITILFGMGLALEFYEAPSTVDRIVDTANRDIRSVPADSLSSVYDELDSLFSEASWRDLAETARRVSDPHDDSIRGNETDDFRYPALLKLKDTVADSIIAVSMRAASQGQYTSREKKIEVGENLVAIFKHHPDLLIFVAKRLGDEADSALDASRRAKSSEVKSNLIRRSMDLSLWGHYCLNLKDAMRGKLDSLPEPPSRHKEAPIRVT